MVVKSSTSPSKYSFLLGFIWYEALPLCYKTMNNWISGCKTPFTLSNQVDWIYCFLCVLHCSHWHRRPDTQEWWASVRPSVRLPFQTIIRKSIITQFTSNLIKPPQSGVSSCFHVVSVVSAAAAKTFASHGKGVCASPLIFGTKMYRSVKMYWLTFHYLDPKSRLWHWFKKLLVCTIMWETLIRSIKNMAVLSLQSCLLPDNIWDQFCWEHVFRGIHFFKIPDVFTPGQTLYWPHLRNSWFDRCETKGSSSVG